MFTSSADVFRTRQVTSDLTAYVTRAGRKALCRILPDAAMLERLVCALEGQSRCFRIPQDRDAYGDVLLAAALPNDDFPAFACATALLLLDRIGQGDGEDDLFWNWDAFADHYRLGDPAVRAVIMNGFRTGAALGRVSISSLPDPEDCLTESRERVLERLRTQDLRVLSEAIESDISAEHAGSIWLDCRAATVLPEMLAGIRYLYERPNSLMPEAPETAPLIPWSI